MEVRFNSRVETATMRGANGDNKIQSNRPHG